ncbi:PAQR family membrane homeostasis protein TrhA [Aquimarina brevivitae]|uniref:Hemolysin III n=1 Tax=Aquimarina brevivitae TaxID=323412 RepID=A0A4Q7NTS5_9FLAO|nr:hemolysin III family protein [Aquimarina brevivitae]RZS90424.1 hemolysin III [Aquimarina brevivitae]
MNDQTPLEERWNWITHGVAALASVFGLALLLVKTPDSLANGYVSVIIYALALLFLYTASTVYHYVERIDLKNRLRVLDHIGIYVLIAGTYTPVTLITLIDSKGWILFITVWSIALVGTILKLFFTGKFEAISLLLYVVMGWLIVIDMEQLNHLIADTGLWYLALGGIAYTSGIVFYVWKKLYFNHVIWHVFVMAGSLFHFIFIYNFVLP